MLGGQSRVGLARKNEENNKTPVTRRTVGFPIENLKLPSWDIIGQTGFSVRSQSAR
jgi:hypothetical protein